MSINLRVLLMASLVSFQAAAAPIQFEDTSDKLGFNQGTETWGIAWGNLNQDEYPDLWNSGHRDLPRLYQNSGDGDFDDVGLLYDRGLNGHWLDNTGRDTHGGAWGDFDNDGDDDLVVGDDDELYTNHASIGGLFTYSNVNAPQQWAGWNNTDGDRELEIDLTCGTSQNQGQYMLLFDVDGNGDTETVCGAAGRFPYSVNGTSSTFIPNINMSNDAAIGDFNNDLLTDIIVTRGAVRPNGASKIDSNKIEGWFRTGPASAFTFTAPGEVVFLVDGNTGGPFLKATELVLNTNGQTSGSARGVIITYGAASGLWTVSYDGADQAYVRITSVNAISEPTMTVFDDADLPQVTYHGVNSATGINWRFTTGLNQPRSCVSVVAADFDNDMDIDLYMACRDAVENIANRYFDNDGDGTFTEVTGHGGEGPIGAGTEFGVAGSVITADYDVDGFMDLAVSNGLLFYPYGFGGPDTLIRNKGNSNHWIQLDLIGTVSPRAAIGAKVYLTAGGVTQLREQSAGYHRYSQNYSRIHFGLAANTSVDEIRIEWPSGQVDTYTSVAADSLYNVTENGNILPAVLDATAVAIEPGEECGQPPYNTRLGPVLQVWRVCGTDNWRIRAKGGLGRLTEYQDQVVEGAIVGSGRNFGAVSGISVDANDIVDNTTGKLIDFKLTVQESSTNTKGINLNTNGQTSTCLFLDEGQSDFDRVYIGSTGKQIDLPFDLVGLGDCVLDTDNDGIIDSLDDDDDNDGVLDVNDAFPLDPTESADSDGDGVGDNADAFPNDPTETSDSDADGIGDNSDIDGDNDGMTDDLEANLNNSGDTNIVIHAGKTGSGYNLSNGSQLSLTRNRLLDGNNFGPSGVVNVESLTIRDSVGTLTPAVLEGVDILFDGWVLTNAWSSQELQTIQDWVNNGGMLVSTNDDTGHGRLAELFGSTVNDSATASWTPSVSGHPIVSGPFGNWSSVSASGNYSGLSVPAGYEMIAREGNGRGTVVVGQVGSGLVILLADEGVMRTNTEDNRRFSLNLFAYAISQITSGVVIDKDQDGDGVDNKLDLDSDNDTISDVVEAGLFDSDGNFLVDDLLNDQGSITSAPDTDGDGIPDYLDLESNNAANDGTQFDILSTVNVSFDTNFDGMLSGADANGGIDIDADGIDDLIDTNPYAPGTGPVTPPGDSCDEPLIDNTTEQAIFLWENCSTGKWEVRLSGGGDPSGVIASGKVISSAGFSDLTEFSLEPNDTFDYVSNPQQIIYEMKAWNAAVDGFGFTPLGADACFIVNENVPVFLGKQKLPVTTSLNLDTLASCNAPAEPAQCGSPVYDKASEPGLYIWKDCSVSGANDSWQITVAGGGLSWSPYIGRLTATNPLVAAGFQLEANDILDTVPGDNIIDFRFNVANSALDGSDISIPSTSQTCLTVDSIPAGAQVFVGRDKQVKTGAFNLENLGPCL